MQRSFLTRASLLALACATIVAAACSDDSGTLDPVIPASAKSGTTGTTGTTGGTDSSGHTPTPTPTSNGLVASVRVTPQHATIGVGYYLTIGAVALDASGQVVAGKHATLRSSDANVVKVVSDTGTIVAKGVGTAVIYATIDGFTDSASVTVIGAPPMQPPPTPRPAVSSFDLMLTISGAVAGSDTSHRAPIAGAIVKLARTGGVTGDTLATSIDAGGGTTDANGMLTIKGLAGGSYVVDVTPPAGSAYQAMKTGFAPPRDANVIIGLVLRPKS